MKTTLSFIISVLCIGFCNAQLHDFDGEGTIFGHGPNDNRVTIGSNQLQGGYGLDPLASVLELTSPNASFLRLGATNSELFLFASDQFGHRILTPQGSPLEINTILRTDRDYVSINTTVIPTNLSEVYRLVVGGKILTEGVRVELEANWADYVFAPNYNLKPIYEVEQFIKDNGHLPNIPNTATVEEEGIDLGDMVTKQMEKIEELTLYIIEMQKQIDALKAKN